MSWYKKIAGKQFREREVLKAFQALGFQVERQKGSHVIMFNPKTGKRISIPYHNGSYDFSEGLLKKIVRHDAGLDYNYFIDVATGRKTAQSYDQLSQQYNEIIQHSPVSVNLTGSGLSQSIPIGGKTISARDLMQKAVDKIKPILTKNNVREINTDPISQTDAIGLAKSHTPGKVYVDIAKIFNQVRNNTLPSISQLDGAKTDPDIVNDAVNKISSYLLSQLGEVSAHESKHSEDFFGAFQSNKPFNVVQESPAEQFGKQVRKQYFSTEFNQ